MIKSIDKITFNARASELIYQVFFYFSFPFSHLFQALSQSYLAQLDSPSSYHAPLGYAGVCLRLVSDPSRGKERPNSKTIAGQASPDIHTFIDRSNTIMESGDDRGHSQKQRKLGQDQNVTPSDTDSQIEQGPPKKRKLAQEQDLPTVDIDSRRVSSCLKRQRLPNKRDSTTPTAIHLSQGLPNKQQLAQDQSITPPDTDSSEQESRCSAPDTRHRRAKWSLERHARSMEECCQDFFTLARVNITAVCLRTRFFLPTFILYLTFRSTDVYTCQGLTCREVQKFAPVRL